MNNKLDNSWIRTLVIVITFTVFTFFFNWISSFIYIFQVSPERSDFFRYGEMIVALIAAFLVVDQLHKETEAEKRESLISQSTFIKEYNQAFIENEKMTSMEALLEEFYTQFIKINKEEIETKNNIISSMEEKIGPPGSPNRQNLINYLVYLEGLAAVIYNNTMKLSLIDSLFGYRFFIAVNNPVVQCLELGPYAVHYQGIYWLYDKWIKYRIYLDFIVSENNSTVDKKRLKKDFKKWSKYDDFWAFMFSKKVPEINPYLPNVGRYDLPAFKNRNNIEMYDIPMQCEDFSLYDFSTRGQNDGSMHLEYNNLIKRFETQISLE